MNLLATCLPSFRLLNVLMIGLTVILVFLAQGSLMNFTVHDWPNLLSTTAAIMCMAAAGNLMNDVVDVATDAINRPGTNPVGDILSRREALRVYAILSVAAFILATYGFYRHDDAWLLIGLVSIHLSLWTYNVVWQKQLLLGNLLIGFLCGSLPLISYKLLRIELYQAQTESYFIGSITAEQLTIGFTATMAFLSFAFNFTRELVKDLEDVIGDKQCGYRTLATTLGFRNFKLIVSIIMILLSIICLSLGWVILNLEGVSWNIPVAALVSLPLVYTSIQFMLTTESSDLIAISKLLKFSLAMGLLTCLMIMFL